MKKLSIRARILASVVVINLVGALVLMVFLHQSYASGLLDSAANTGIQGLAAWNQFSPPDGFHPLAEPARALDVLERMKAVTGAEYGLLVNKEVVDEAAYDAARESLEGPSLWGEGDTYALLVTTDALAAEEMLIQAPVSEIDEGSTPLGMEVGSCAHACHGAGSKGDFWTVRASSDDVSSGHAVFPVYAGGIDPIGVIYAIEDVSVQAVEASHALTQTLIAVGLTLVVAAMTIGALLDILVFRRLARMTSDMKDISMRVAGGDFDAHFQPDGTSDEIGSFEKFFSDFISVVSMTLKQLSGR